MQIEEIRDIAVAALEEIKARDIVVLDVKRLTALFDYMIVASGDSARHAKALTRNVHDKVKDAGGQVIGLEGEQTGEWVLVDLGGVVVHIMQPAVREYYSLEELWGGQAARRTASVRRPASFPTGAVRT